MENFKNEGKVHNVEDMKLTCSCGMGFYPVKELNNFDEEVGCSRCLSTLPGFLVKKVLIKHFNDEEKME